MSGEFAVVERTYAEDRMFEFTTRNNHKIKSADDVAFIFCNWKTRPLNGFAIYIDKDKFPLYNS